MLIQAYKIKKPPKFGWLFLILFLADYKCITSPYAAAVASIIASLIVGCG